MRWSSKNKSKLAQKRCIVRGYRSFIDFCDLTNKYKSHTSEVEIHTKRNYAILAAMLRKRSYVFSKFQVLKHKFTLQKQSKLNKVHTDRMNERNSNEERCLYFLYNIMVNGLILCFSVYR